jgi:hypothetical protein
MKFSNRAATILGLTLLADGASYLANPEGMLRFWSFARSPRWYRRCLRFLEERPRLSRLLAGAEVLAGSAVLSRAGA